MPSYRVKLALVIVILGLNLQDRPVTKLAAIKPVDSLCNAVCGQREWLNYRSNIMLRRELQHVLGVLWSGRTACRKGDLFPQERLEGNDNWCKVNGKRVNSAENVQYRNEPVNQVSDAFQSTCGGGSSHVAQSGCFDVVTSNTSTPFSGFFVSRSLIT